MSDPPRPPVFVKPGSTSSGMGRPGLYQSPAFNGDPPSWFAFAGWAVVGSMYAFAILGILTIGIFVLPVAILLTLVMASTEVRRRGVLGLVAGVGLLSLQFAKWNWGGPGEVCFRESTYEVCEERWTPWPFLAVGLLLVGMAVWLFRRARRNAVSRRVMSGLA